MILDKCTIQYPFDIEKLGNIRVLSLLNCKFDPVSNVMSPQTVKQPILKALEKLLISSSMSEPICSFASLAHDLFNIDTNVGYLSESFKSLREVKMDVSFAEKSKALISPFLKDGSVFANYRSAFAVTSLPNIFKAMEPRTSITIKVSQLDIQRQGIHTVNVYEPL